MDDATKAAIQAFLAGRLRHLLAGAGAYLAVTGVFDKSQVDPFVEIGFGIVTYLASDIWSFLVAHGMLTKLNTLRSHIFAIPYVSTESNSLEHKEEVNDKITDAKHAASGELK